MTTDIDKHDDNLQEVKKDVFLNNLKRMPNYNYFAKDINLRYMAEDCSESIAMYANVDSPKQLQGKSDHDLIWRNSSADGFVKTDRLALANRPQINEKETVLVYDGYHDFLITKVKMFNHKEEAIGIIGINICVDNYTLTEKKGKLDIEEKRLYLGKAFNDDNLTKRQTQVFIGILKGHPISEIAYILNIKPGRIRNIVKELQGKLQCKSVADIVRIAVKNGWHFLMSDDLIYKKI